MKGSIIQSTRRKYENNSINIYYTHYGDITMARITIEDCLNHTPNRFALVNVAAQRASALVQGASPKVTCNNKEVVTALREVAAGKIKPS